MLAAAVRRIQLDPQLEVSQPARRDPTHAVDRPPGVPRFGMGALARNSCRRCTTTRCDSGRKWCESTSQEPCSPTASASRRALLLLRPSAFGASVARRACARPGIACGCVLLVRRTGAPLPGRTLILDGDKSGPAKNVAVMSEVSPSYVPRGPSAHRSCGARARRARSDHHGFVCVTNLLVGPVRPRPIGQHLRTDVIAHAARQGPPFGPSNGSRGWWVVRMR